MIGRGLLTVAVRTAGLALPVCGAMVTVTEAEAMSPPLRVLVTDDSGRTAPLELPAPQAEGSLTPGAAVRPYAIYRILVEKEGYYPHENEQVPVFAGVASLQPAELIPLAPYEQAETRPGGNLTYTASQTLREGKEDAHAE